MTKTAEYEIVRIEADEEELVATGSLDKMYELLETLRAELDGEDDNYKVQPAQD